MAVTIRNNPVKSQNREPSHFQPVYSLSPATRLLTKRLVLLPWFAPRAVVVGSSDNHGPAAWKVAGLYIITVLSKG